MSNQFIRYWLIVVGFFIEFSSVFAQQNAQFTQWSAHQFSFNPAHAGIKTCMDVHALFRMQWVGFEGAPRSGVITLTAPLETRRKQYFSARHGLGFRMESDRIGQFNTTRFNLAYAGHFNFTQDTRLSLGLFAGAMQFGYDPSKTVTIDVDPTVFKEASFIAPDASFGAWWNGKNYYAGLVLQNLIPIRWTNIGDQSRFRIHTLINGGYRFSMSETFTLLPSVMVRIPSKGPLSIDAQVMADWQNKVQLGIGYRNQDALLFFAGFKINSRFSVLYSFDLTTSALRKASSNSHELSIILNNCAPAESGSLSCPLF
jgi:type IX secretion system PorP/SprF family membrane protein